MLKIVKLSALLFVLLVAGCSSTKRELVGKWELDAIAGTEKSGTQWEFFKSGDLWIYSGTAKLFTYGEYSWIDRNRIRYHFPKGLTHNAISIAGVKIDGDKLTLSGYEPTLHFTRIP